MSAINPYRTRSAGTAALEHGVRTNVPKDVKAPPEPTHASAKSQPFTTAALRPVVSRFGGMVLESHAVHIPKQPAPLSAAAADNDNDFESRFKPEVTNVYAGIPGYTGFKAQGSHPSVLGVTAAPPAHVSDQSALDTSMQPYVMPMPGYGGHIRGLSDADKSYGTSHWKNAGKVNPSQAPAASKPWDGRDVAGRAFCGETPSDFGRYEDPEGIPGSPEYERRAREAAEANEILELRSMGIRATLGVNDTTKGPAASRTPSAAATATAARRDARLKELEAKLGVDKTEINSMKMQIDTTAWGVSKQQDEARKTASFQ